MAAPRLKITPAVAGLLLRDLQHRHIPAAVAAGHAPPKVELNYADGLSRDQAKALYAWALTIPAIYKALHVSSNPAHREVAAFRDLVNYFQFDHPQRPDGRAASWAEAGQPLSVGLEGYLLGRADTIEASHITPAEAASLLDYAEVRGAEFRDPAAPQVATFKAEIEALSARAAETGEAASTTGREGPTMANESQAQARADELRQALRGRLSASDRAKMTDELAAILAGDPFAGDTELPTPASPAGPESAAAANSNFAVLTAGPQITARAIALTDELRGMKYRGSADRQAALAQLEAELRASDAAQPPASAGGSGDSISADAPPAAA